MDLSVFIKIASVSIEAYRAMLAIPIFARYSKNFVFPVHFSQKEVDNQGNIIYYFNNKKYFAKYQNGDKYWFHNDVVHRNKLPATIRLNGLIKSYHQYGKYHNEYPYPALIHDSGNTCWYYHGEHYYIYNNRYSKEINDKRLAQAYSIKMNDILWLSASHSS